MLWKNLVEVVVQTPVTVREVVIQIQAFVHHSQHLSLLGILEELPPVNLITSVPMKGLNTTQLDKYLLEAHSASPVVQDVMMGTVGGKLTTMEPLVGLLMVLLVICGLRGLVEIVLTI